MKASRAQIEHALIAPSDTRFFLFHGPDEAGSRAWAAKLVQGQGEQVERIDLTGPQLAEDPARLADEAASISLFGGVRCIIVIGVGDESLPAVAALLEAPVAGNPVVLVAGALKPASKLLKLALEADSALVFASYVPDGADASRLVQELAQANHLRLDAGVAQRIAEAMGGNRALIDQELGKFALYLGADSTHPQSIDHAIVDLLGTDSEEGDLTRLVDSAVSGDPVQLQSEITRLSGEGIDGIRLIRALLRRMALLARLRAQIEHGQSVSAVMAAQGKTIFWKEKEAIARQVSRWSSGLIAKGISRLVEAERQVKASSGLGTLAADEELFAICRQAARRR